MDALVDADEPIASADAQTMFGVVYGLLKSGDMGAFQDKYRQALQDSPDVVMAHAGVSAILPDVLRPHP